MTSLTVPRSNSSLSALDTVRVAIADDQALVLEGMTQLLHHMHGVKLVIAASSGAQLLQQLASTPADVAIIDIRMPGLSGFDVVRQLAAQGSPVRTILLTTFDEPDLLAEAIRAGARGFLLKGVSPTDLSNAIHAVANGDRVLSAVDVAVAHAVKDFSAGATVRTLTAREREILRLVAAGYSNKEIALALNLVEGTIKNYMSELLMKLSARDRTHAVLRAIAAGLL